MENKLIWNKLPSTPKGENGKEPEIDKECLISDGNNVLVGKMNKYNCWVFNFSGVEVISEQLGTLRYWMYWEDIPKPVNKTKVIEQQLNNLQ